MVSEEALQIAEKRRDMKGKGEKGRQTHLNAEFQRIARRDKKDFLSDQCKEIKENNKKFKLYFSSKISIKVINFSLSSVLPKFYYEYF